MEATNLLKSSRETLFAIDSVIEPSNVLNNQEEVRIRVNVDVDVDVDVDIRCPVLVLFLPQSLPKGTLWGDVKA